MPRSTIGRFLKLPLDEMLARADYVICLAVANEETENLMDAAAFARLKPDAFFINMSRGNLVDEGALRAALAETALRVRPWTSAGRLTRCRRRNCPPAERYRDTPYRGLTPPASESQAFDTVRQVEALVKGETPQGAANLKDWTRRG
jgi:D-3-phosphoglycerate dehydrogenase